MSAKGIEHNSQTATTSATIAGFPTRGSQRLWSERALGAFIPVSAPHLRSSLEYCEALGCAELLHGLWPSNGRTWRIVKYVGTCGSTSTRLAMKLPLIEPAPELPL
jgi:hypothetical protein